MASVSGVRPKYRDVRGRKKVPAISTQAPFLGFN